MAFDLPRLTKTGLTSWTRNRREIDRLMENMLANFSDPFSVVRDFGGDFVPRADFSDTGSVYKVELEIPGIDQKDIEIKLEDNILTIIGKKEEKSETEEKNYYAQERFYGSFRRSFALPANVNENEVKAAFENGILAITLPKKDQKAPKKIEIKS